jgi:hypothetical protein
VEHLSSNDHITYHQATEHILNLPSNLHAPSRVSSKKSKAQHEAKGFSSSFKRIERGISPAKVSPSEFISAFETEWNQIAHLSQSSAAASSRSQQIMKDLFAYQDAKRGLLLAWFPEFHHNVVENLSSNDHITYHQARKHILNLPSTFMLPSKFPPRSPSLNTRLTASLRRIERRTRKRR